jgi:hypothetical protein
MVCGLLRAVHRKFTSRHLPLTAEAIGDPIHRAA